MFLVFVLNKQLENDETSMHPGIEKQKEDVGQPPDTKTKQTSPSFSQL